MNTWNISTLQMQIFLKAAETKNFTKTANSFNYTPSMVSKTITTVEDELGIKLFERKPHDLSLTPAGEVLASEWHHFIGSFNNSVSKAIRAQNESKSRIVFGFVDSSDEVDRNISSAIREYSASNPGIHLLAEKHDMHRAVELLNFGLLDLIQTSDMELSYITDMNLQWEKVFDTHAAIYVPKGSPLFERDSIDMQDIKKSDILSLDRSMHPSYHKWLMDLCGSYGFQPSISNTYRTVRSLLFSLKMGNALFIGNSITSDWCDEYLKAFPLETETFSLMAWRDGSRKEVLDFKDFLISKY